MQQNYIQAPSEPNPIAIHNGKVFDTKPVSPDDVPVSYRKNRFAKSKIFLFELILYYIGFTELMRKGNSV